MGENKWDAHRLLSSFKLEIFPHTNTWNLKLWFLTLACLYFLPCSGGKHIWPRTLLDIIFLGHSSWTESQVKVHPQGFDGAFLSWSIDTCWHTDCYFNSIWSTPCLCYPSLPILPHMLSLLRFNLKILLSLCTPALLITVQLNVLPTIYTYYLYICILQSKKSL